jgi:hypothetical protein
MKIFTLELLALCHRGKFIFLKYALNSASFDTHIPHIVKKILWMVLPAGSTTYTATKFFLSFSANSSSKFGKFQQKFSHL